MHATDQPAGVKPTIVLVHGAFAIAAFATEEGENLNDVESGSQDSILGAALVQYKDPAGPDGETAVELAVDPALFREAFAAELPAETAALMAATQRPTAVTAFSEPSGPPAWKKKYRRDFSKLIWRLASPGWAFDDATFARSAAAFDNPDHVAIVIHSYRWRLGVAAGESRYDDLERRLAAFPDITVPTITLEGDANGAPHPDASGYAGKFTGKYEHRLVEGGVGRNLPQEAPQAFAEAIIDADSLSLGDENACPRQQHPPVPDRFSRRGAYRPTPPGQRDQVA